MRIFLTRRPSQAGDLEAGLREAGYEVGFLPLTEQRLPEDRSGLSAAVGQLERGDFAVLMLTSGNTVRFLMTAGWSGTLPEETETAVTGRGTARVLQELTEINDPWMPTGEASAEGVLAEIPHPPEQDMRLLLPQSAQARPRLAEGLRELGWQVSTVIAYQTVPMENPEVGVLQPSDVVLVTSSSAAEACMTLDLPTRPHTLAIGRPTAETLRSQGAPADAVLREPTAAGVLRALRHSSG